MISDKTGRCLRVLFDTALKYNVLRVRLVIKEGMPRFENANHGKWVNLAVFCFSTICILQIVTFLIWQVTFGDYSIPTKLYTVGLISIALLLLSANSFLHFNYKDCAAGLNMLIRLVALEGEGNYK
jgi:hypothetical protein